jgi:hypothetical protein
MRKLFRQFLNSIKLDEAVVEWTLHVNAYNFMITSVRGSFNLFKNAFHGTGVGN